MDEFNGQAVWHALSTEEDAFEAWAEAAVTGDLRKAPSVVELDVKQGFSANEAASTPGTGSKRIAIISWRWQAAAPKDNIERVRNIVAKARDFNYEYVLIDLVSIDQAGPRDLITQVRDYSTLYSLLPVVSFYPVSLTEGFQQRGWINYEYNEFLGKERVHKSSVLMPEFEGKCSGLKLKSLYSSVYGIAPSKVSLISYKSYQGWRDYLEKVESIMRKESTGHLAEGVQVKDPRTDLLSTYLQGTYFTDYLDNRFTWTSLNEEQQLQMLESCQYLPNDIGRVLVGAWWLTQITVLSNKASLSVPYKHDETSWDDFAQTLESRGFRLNKKGNLSWKNANILILITEKRIFCTKTSKNANATDWSEDAYKLLLP